MSITQNKSFFIFLIKFVVTLFKCRVKKATFYNSQKIFTITVVYNNSVCPLFVQITIDLDIEYSTANNGGGGGGGSSSNGRNRTSSLFSSRPESPTESTDERQMLLDVEQNIANLEKTFCDSRRSNDRQEDETGGGGKDGVDRAHKKGLFRYSSYNVDKDASGNDRKR